MKTHQEIHNMIESACNEPNSPFTLAEIFHALNDRVSAHNDGFNKRLEALEATMNRATYLAASAHDDP